MAFTTLDLLSSIERRSFIPTNQNTYSQAELLAIADEITSTDIVPAIMSCREDYFVHTSTIPVVANQALYDLPARSVNASLREIKLTNSDRNKNLVRVEIENLHSNVTGNPHGFYFKGSNLGLYPTPSSDTGSIQYDFYLGPGSLVLPSASAIIASINTSTNIVSFSSLPATFTTGTVFDFVSAKGEQNYREISQTSTLVSGTDVTFSALPTGLSVGDYVTLEGTSPLLQMPTIFRYVLAQGVAAQILMSTGQSGAGDAFQLFQKLLTDAVETISPRVHGQARDIIQRNW